MKAGTHKNLALGVRNSPFVAFWFVSLAPLMEAVELVRCCNEASGISVERELASVLEKCNVYLSSDQIPKEASRF